MTVNNQQPRMQRPTYDVAIIGSGAGGGMAAYALTKAGARVVMLEAGPKWFASQNSKMLVPSYATPHRGASIHGRPFGEFDACDGGWEIDGEPYTRAPGTDFSWWRARMLGGRTNHWGRISLRFGPDAFRRKSLDGLGDDWPITYAAVKLGIWCIPARLSIITKPLGMRAPCHYCGQCNRGCMTNSNFTSPNVLI